MFVTERVSPDYDKKLCVKFDALFACLGSTLMGNYQLNVMSFLLCCRGGIRKDEVIKLNQPGNCV